jgi:homoserine kinase
LAANVLTGSKLSQAELLDLAVKLEGHPDNVAPAILGGLVVSAQTANGLYCRRIVPPAELKMIVAIPKFELSTHESRDILPRQVNLQDAVFNMGRACLLVTAFMTGDLELLRPAISPDLVNLAARLDARA